MGLGGENAPSMTADDLLFGSPTKENRAQGNKSDIDILNEILGSNGSSMQGVENENSFSKTWKDMFGDEPVGPAQPSSQEPNQSWSQGGSNFMMPSDLLNSMARFDPFSEVPRGAPPQQAIGAALKMSAPMQTGKHQESRPGSKAKQASLLPGKVGEKGKGKGKKGQDMSAWFSLFSDLDPLANPDAIDKQNKKSEEDRQC